MRNKQQNKQKDILFILISSFILVVAWIAFNIYHIIVTSTVNQHIQFQLTPVDPTFDQQTMQELKTREDINPNFESQPIATGASAPQVAPLAPTQTPSQSPSGAPSVSSAPNSSRFAPTTAPIGRQGQ